MIKDRFVQIAVAATLAVASAPASALGSVSGGEDGLWPCEGLGFSIGPTSPCYGSVAPPPNDSLSAINTIFGTSFTSAFKDENKLIGSSVPSVYDAAQTGTASGTITFAAGFTDPFVLVLKLGNGWSAYLFDADFAPGDVLSYGPNGSFNFATVNGLGLSHATIYSSCRNGDCEGQEVPEPGTLALLGLALAGLAAARRRRR